MQTYKLTLQQAKELFTYGGIAIKDEDELDLEVAFLAENANLDELNEMI